MAESSQYAFKHKEVAEALIKQQGIHEGIWGIHIRFGLAAANLGGSEEDFNPTAIIPVVEIGLQKMDKVTNISVDAAVVNPSTGKAGKKTKTAKS